MNWQNLSNQAEPPLFALQGIAAIKNGACDFSGCSGQDFKHRTHEAFAARGIVHELADGAEQIPQ
jgi:hypothetical protein